MRQRPALHPVPYLMSLPACTMLAMGARGLLSVSPPRGVSGPGEFAGMAQRGVAEPGLSCLRVTALLTWVALQYASDERAADRLWNLSERLTAPK